MPRVLPKKIPDAIYHDLPSRLARIDKRSTKYQFDLEEDIPWDRLDEPGLYCEVGMARQAGIDMDALQSISEAWELFQWSSVIDICHTIITLELGIIFFITNNHAVFRDSRSAFLMKEEEKKHIRLFRKIGDYVRALRPTLAREFDGIFHANPQRFRFAPTEIAVAESVLGKAAPHYLMWLSAVFFEEYTIYVHHRLRAAADGSVQPVWLAAHALHRREELHHLVTDAHYLEASSLDAKQREIVSTLFVCQLMTKFLSVDNPLGDSRILLQRKFPDLSITRPESDLPVRCLQELLSEKAFSRACKYIPFLDEMLSMDPGEAWARAVERIPAELRCGRDPGCPPWRNISQE